MFIGINTNIQHKGEIYHVQTEDGGLNQHTLTTILFKNGVILSSKKSSYLDVPKSADYEETVKEMMQKQHKQMLRDLVGGKLDIENGRTKTGQAMTGNGPADPGPMSEKHGNIDNEEEKGMNPKEQAVHKKGLDALISEYLSKKEAEHV